MRDRAAIGTIIVFVATVLLASAAAAILISTHRDVRPADTSSDLDIAQVVARRDSAHNPFLSDLDIYVLAHAELELHQVGVSILAGGYDLHSPASDLRVRNMDGQPVAFLGEGRIAVISVSLHDAGFVVGTGDGITIRIDDGGASNHSEVVVGPLGKAIVIPLQ